MKAKSSEEEPMDNQKVREPTPDQRAGLLRVFSGQPPENLV